MKRRLPSWANPRGLVVLPLMLIGAMVIGVPLDNAAQWIFAGIVTSKGLANTTSRRSPTWPTGITRFSWQNSCGMRS